MEYSFVSSVCRFSWYVFLFVWSKDYQIDFVVGAVPDRFHRFTLKIVELFELVLQALL